MTLEPATSTNGTMYSSATKPLTATKSNLITPRRHRKDKEKEDQSRLPSQPSPPSAITTATATATADIIDHHQLKHPHPHQHQHQHQFQLHQQHSLLDQTEIDIDPAEKLRQLALNVHTARSIVNTNDISSGLANNHNHVHPPPLPTPMSLFRSDNHGDDADDDEFDEYHHHHLHDCNHGHDHDDHDDDHDSYHHAIDSQSHSSHLNGNGNATLSSSANALRQSHRVKRIASAVRTILECLDDDPRRKGLHKTPERYAKALLFLTEGYSQTVDQVVKDAKFTETPSESVMVRDIDVFSLCEHHMLPFHGVCHVSYLPNSHVIGLSKVARIVNMYARRLQVQERLTAQIADAVMQATNAHGVMVVVTCAHMCMSMRGVEKVGAQTTTTVTRGRYSTDAPLRSEFLATISCTQQRR